MDGGFSDIWVYLSASPLLHLFLTLLAYLGGQKLYERLGMHPLVNPVLIAVIVLVVILVVTETPYLVYFEGAQFVHFLLGPATVALALPLYRQVSRIRKAMVPILLSVIFGSLVATGSAVAIAWGFGVSEATLISIAPKSVTTPVAMGISEKLGGLPSLTAVFVILTGILGAMIGPLMLDLFRFKDWAARGFAIGIAAHGIGTARAMQVSEVAGAFSGLAMGLNALATAILLPLLWRLFF